VRYAKRTDRNHQEIRDGLRATYLVCDLSDVGNGVPDIAVQPVVGGVAIFLEVKDPKQPPSKRGLTEAEKRWFTLVPDRTFVVHTLDEALKVCREFFKEPTP
jgi:hypothetical protein